MMIKNLLTHLIHNKEAKNAGWIMTGKIIQMLLSFVISILTARYLGPANFGTINYAGAYVSFFMAFCTLGINSVIIKDFIDNPEEEGKAIGTTIVLRAISSFLSSLLIIVIVFFVDYGETVTLIVTILCSTQLVFHAFDTFNYWFQSRYMSKITAIATLIAYFFTSAYKILLLIFKKNIYWFGI